MTDYKFISDLLYSKKFKNIDYSENITQQRNNLLILIIDNITSKFYEAISPTIKDIYNKPTYKDEYETILKFKENNDKVTNAELYEAYKNTLPYSDDNFIINTFKEFYGGTSATNVFSYVYQIITRSNSGHVKLTDHNSIKYHRVVKNIIEELSNTKEYNVIETQDKQYKNANSDCNGEYNDKLIYKLERDDNDIDSVGISQIKLYQDRYKDIIDIKHKRSIFIEGSFSTGKTTLASHIAYEYSNNHSYYFDLKNFDEEVTDSIKNSINLFLKVLHDNSGIIILDNINASVYGINLAQTYFKQNNQYKIPIIYISVLEQQNTLTNIITHTEKFSEYHRLIDHKDICIEITNKDRIDILKYFLYTYLEYKDKKRLLDSLNQDILEYLDDEFQGVLYLLKIALDNQKDTTLNDLKIEQSHKVVLDKYKVLIDNYSNETSKPAIVSLLLLSSLNIYYRVNKDYYENVFILENPYIEDLIKKKLLYKVIDKKINTNYVLYFPNLIVVRYILTYIQQKTKKSFNELLLKKSIINTMINHSYTNIDRLKRYFKDDIQYIEKLHKSKIIYTNQDNNKIELTTIIQNLDTVLSNNNTKELKILKNKLFKNSSIDNFKIILKYTNDDVIVSWYAILLKSLKGYAIEKKLQVSKIPSIINKPTNNTIKRLQLDLEYIKLMYEIIELSLKALQQLNDNSITSNVKKLLKEFDSNVVSWNKLYKVL